MRYYKETMVRIQKVYRERKGQEVGSGKYLARGKDNITQGTPSLGALNKMKLMLCVLFSYNMGNKIKRLSMNVAFKYIWPKGLKCFPMEGLSI